MNLAIIVAHPDDAEIWMGGTMLTYWEDKHNISIIYPLEVSNERKKEAVMDKRWKTHFTNDLFSDLLNINPDLVFTHWNNDSHKEHREVFLMVNKVMPELVVSNLLVTRLFCFGSYNNLGLGGELFKPTDFIDISNHWDGKHQMIFNYKSQKPELWVNMIKPINELWGNQCCVKYAEGFLETPILGVMRRSRKIL